MPRPRRFSSRPSSNSMVRAFALVVGLTEWKADSSLVEGGAVAFGE